MVLVNLPEPVEVTDSLASKPAETDAAITFVSEQVKDVKFTFSRHPIIRDSEEFIILGTLLKTSRSANRLCSVTDCL